MNGSENGVRGEVSEYTWGRVWGDGTKEFNNGAIQYPDGSLEFDGLTFYPDGVVIDATGQQVGLAADGQVAQLDVEPVGEVQDATQPTTEEETELNEPEQEQDSLNQAGEGETLIIEDENDTQYYVPDGSDER
ncbi:hypothetical protein [Pseudomonas sp. NFX15]|uniref:hypothetical protein n=1 Tax=Pseudomonas sp. NFX15 TaxID=2816958 RepID=UPI003B8E0954